MAKPDLASMLRNPQLQSALQPGLLGLAALLGLGAALFIWVGMSGLQAEPAGGDLVVARDNAVTRIANRAVELRGQLQKVLDDPRLRADLAAGAGAEAAQRLRAAWPAVTHAEVFPAQLELVVDATGDAGYGRAAVVGEALQSEQVVFGVIGRGDAAQLAMAQHLRDDDADLGVMLIELPIASIADLVNSVEPGGGLIELRYHEQTLVTRGDDELRGRVQPLTVPTTPFVVAAAMPASATGTGPLTSLVVGGVLIVLTVVVLALRKRVGGAAPAAAANEPTLAEALARSRPEPAPTPSAAVAEANERAKPKPVVAVAVDRSIFRAYDIRGVVGKTLDVGVAKLIGQAIGSVMHDKGLREIVVGRDGRLSGPELSAALIDGLRATGCDVIDIGQAATPVVYFASYHLHAGSCVAVTGSHNPPDYNGFKIVLDGETLSGETIQDLYTRIVDNALHSASPGGMQTIDVSRDYIDRIASDVQLERRMRVVIDCGNGVPGAVAPDVLEAIGAEAEALYCDVDGTFPNHHPDPSDPDNLRDLITAVQRTGAEIGLAFDGDGDRLGVVTAAGRIIYPDRVLMLFAQDVLSRNPGAAVIYDVKCTGHLSGQILRNGGSPIMWKTGHSLIKAKMRETAAELAGEMSGHFFFKERWYGFDDGIYAAARLLEILAADDRDAEEIFAELPEGVSTPELKVEMVEGEHYAFMEQFRERARFEGAKIFTIDGVRADWPDGWGLVRCSNTTPCLVLRFDADSEVALKRIQEEFRAQIEAVRGDLRLPF